MLPSDEAILAARPALRWSPCPIPLAPAPAALARLAVTVGPQRLAVGAAAVVVVYPVGAGAGMERGHRCLGASLPPKVNSGAGPRRGDLPNFRPPRRRRARESRAEERTG